MHCDYCYYLRKEDNLEKGKMTFETASQMIKSILDYNTNSVRFMWHGGEPLLSGLDMFEAVVNEQKRLNTKGLIVNNIIQTNGVLLNNDWVKFFTKYNFTVGVSLDGPYNLCKHRNITRANFNKILQGIELLNSSNVYTGLLTVITHKSVNHARDIFNFFTEVGIKRVRFLPCVVSDSVGKINKTLSIRPEEYGIFLSMFLDTWLESGITDFVFENFDDYIRGKRKIVKAYCSQRNGCGNSLTIASNGNIYLCDSFCLTMNSMVGNVKLGFFEVCDHLNFKTFIKKIKKLPQKCINCRFIDCCAGGCSFHRWLISHDFRGDSYLCHGIKIFFNHIEEIIKNTKIKF